MMAQVHSWWDMSAAIKLGKWHSSECWNQTESIVHSTHQHSPTGWSDHFASHPSTQAHMVVRSSYIAPISTGPHGGQIIVHSTHQHSPSGWSDHCASHPSALALMVVRSLCILTHQHSPTGWLDHLAFHLSTVPYGSQIIVHSTHQPRPTGQSDHCAFHPTTQSHMVVRSTACGAVAIGGWTSRSKHGTLSEY